MCNKQFTFFIVIFLLAFVFAQENEIIIEDVTQTGVSDVTISTEPGGPYYLYFWDKRSKQGSSSEFIATLPAGSTARLSQLNKKLWNKIKSSLKPNKRYWFTINSNHGLDIENQDSVSTLTAKIEKIGIETSDSSAVIELIDKKNPKYTDYLITLISDQDDKPEYVGSEGQLGEEENWFKFNKIKKIEIKGLLPDLPYTLKINTKNLDKKISASLIKKFKTQLKKPKMPSFLHIARVHENFIAKWKLEYSHTDTLIFSSEKESVLIKIAMDKRSMVGEYALNKKLIDSKSINKFYLRRSNRAGSSQPITYSLLSDSLYYEDDLPGYDIPEAVITFPAGGQLMEKDTLKIRFDGGRISQDQIKRIVKALGTDFKRQKGKPVSQELVFLYTGAVKSDQLVVPQFTWISKNGQPTYIDYEIRSRDPTALNVSLSRKVTYSKLSFAVGDYSRYEGVLDDEVLYIPPLRLSQDAGNILQPGDKVVVTFKNTGSLVWVDELAEDQFFDIIHGVAGITFVLREGVDLPQEYTFQELPFKLTTADRSFGIELEVKVLPKRENWTNNYAVQLHKDGLDVGRLAVQAVASTPVYLEDDFPASVIKYIYLQEGSTPVVRAGDELEITLAQGLQFDVNNQASKSVYATYASYQADQIVLTADRDFRSNEQLVLRDIKLTGRPLDPEAVALTVAVRGEGYTQQQTKPKEVFHKGQADSLYYEDDLPGYDIPEAVITFPAGGQLMEKDTLKIRFDGGRISQDQIKRIVKALGTDFKRQKGKPVSQELVFLYTGAVKSDQFVVPQFTWISKNGQPTYIDYEIRSRTGRTDKVSKVVPKKKRWFKFGKKAEKSDIDTELADYSESLPDLNASLSHKVTYSELSFAVGDYSRYEGVLDDEVLYIPPLRLTQDSKNILQPGDQVTVTFKNTGSLVWVDELAEDQFFDIIHGVAGITFVLWEGVDLPQEYTFQELPFKLTTADRSFGIELEVKVLPKRENWTNNYAVQLHKDGLDVGKPVFLIDESFGIVRGRKTNKAPTIRINTRRRAIIRENDQLVFSLLNNSNAFWAKDLSPTINSSKLEFFKKSDDQKSLIFKVVNNFNDSSSITIKELYINKIENDTNDIRIQMQCTHLPKSKSEQLFFKYQKPYLLFENDKIQYAYDDRDDFVTVLLKGNNISINTYWPNDWVNILLPDSSGSKWDINNIRSKYEKSIIVKNNQQLIVPINIFINHDSELTLPIISNNNEPKPFFYRYKFDNIINKRVSLYPSKYYYTSDYFQNQSFYSKLRFSIESNVGVFGKSKASLNFRIPQINIFQDRYSTISINDKIILDLPSDDEVLFTFNGDSLKNITYSKFQANSIRKNINVLNIDVVNKDMDFQTLNINNISTIIKVMKEKISASNEKQISISYIPKTNKEEEYNFPIKEKIVIGSPKLITYVDTLSWPVDQLRSSRIVIDDSESKIIGLNDQVVRVKVQSDQESKYILEWDYKRFTSEQMKQFKVLHNSPSVLQISKKFAGNGQQFVIPSLPLKGPHKFDDINGFHGINIFIKVSFDSGQNYPHETKNDILKIVRPIKIAFTRNCYTHEKYKTHFLPKLVIEENENYSTIDVGDRLLIILNKNDHYYWSSKKLNNDTIKSFTSNNRKTLVLEFLKKLDKSDRIEIKSIQLNSDRDITEKFSPLIVFEENPTVMVDNNFTIFPTNLTVQLEKSKLFNLRNSIYYNGYDDDNEIPDIIIKDDGKYPMLHKSDTLLLSFPDQIIIKDYPYKTNWASEITFNARGYDNKNYLKCIIDSLHNNEVSLSGLTIEYPKTVVDSSNIHYRIINNYNTFKTTNIHNDRVHEIRNKIAISAGQPTIYFKNQKDRRYIIGDQSRKLPTIRLEEELFETHLVAGDSIIFELKDSLGFYWDINHENLVSYPQGIFEEKIIFKDSLYAQLNIKRTLGKSKIVDLDGFFVRVNPDNRYTIYKPTSNRTMINIYGGRNVIAGNRPQKFGYNFDNNKPIKGRLGIGRLDISWPTSILKIREYDAAMGKTEKISTLTIKSTNLDEREIPDTLYLKLSTNSKNNKFDNPDESIWVDESDKQSHENIKFVEVIDRKENNKWSSWLKFTPFDPLENNQSIFIENLKITTRQISFSKSNGNFMNIGLYSNHDKYVLDQTDPKEIILTGDGFDCSKEYYKIFNKKTLLSVELEDNTLKYKLQFNNNDELKLVNQTGETFAYGKNVSDKLIDFEILKDLKYGETYIIQGLNVQFLKIVEDETKDTAIVKIAINTPEGRKTYIPNFGRVIYTEGIIGNSELAVYEGDSPEEMECVLRSLELRENKQKGYFELHFVTNSIPPDKVPPDFRNYAEKLKSEYERYEISVRENKYSYKVDQFNLFEENNLNNELGRIEKEKTEQGKFLDVNNLEYHWCRALLLFLKDYESDLAFDHYKKFKKLKNNNKTYRNDLFIDIVELEQNPIARINAKWEMFKNYLTTARKDNTWDKLFKYHMYVTKNNENLFYILENSIETIRWENDLAKLEMAIGLHDWRYANILFKQINYHYKNNDYKRPDKITEMRMKSEFKVLEVKKRELEYILFQKNGLARKWKKDDEKKSMNIKNEKTPERRLVFYSLDQYSANLYSTNHTFSIQPGGQNYVVLFNSTGDQNNPPQSIYGGGEYLIWPKTREGTNRSYTNSMIIVGVLFSLSLLQLGVF